MRFISEPTTNNEQPCVLKRGLLLINKYGEKYIVAQVDMNTYDLISLKDGNRVFFSGGKSMQELADNMNRINDKQEWKLCGNS